MITLLRSLTILLTLALSSLSAQPPNSNSAVFGQKFEVKDRHGLPIIEISEITLFRYSDYFKADIPELKFYARNLSGDDITRDTLFESGVLLDVTIHKAEGPPFELKAEVIQRPTSSSDPIVLRKDSGVRREYYPDKGSYTSGDFKSIEFKLSPLWKSPEDKRLAAAQRERLQAAQDAKDAKIKAAQDAKNAQELARIRANCLAIYQRTSDMKISELTVKQEQQVRACQTLGLYPPR